MDAKTHVTNDELANRFNHHPPSTPEVASRHEAVRAVCLGAAEEIVEITGAPTREQSLALTHLEQAMFWSNAAVARHQ